MGNLATLLGGIETALSAITGVGKVYRDKDLYGDLTPADFPALFISNDPVYDEWVSFSHPTDPDKEATVRVIVDGRVEDIMAGGAKAAIEALLAVAVAKLASLSVSGLRLVYNETETQDYSFDETQTKGYFRVIQKITYEYNHASP